MVTDNEELNNLYSSLDIVRMMKPRTIRCVGLVTRMSELKNIKFWSENLKKRDHLEDPGVDGSIILK
jgi:hypothetical protein